MELPNNDFCRLLTDRETIALNIAQNTIEDIRNLKTQKMNAIWLEATGCSGNIISLLNATDPMEEKSQP
jgi:hydrogenase small subunit